MKTRSSFDEIVETGDMKCLRELFRSMPESDRNTLARSAVAWYRKSSKLNWIQEANSFHSEYAISKECCKASLHAVLITADDETIGKLSFPGFRPDLLDWDFLREFKPRSLNGWAQKLIADGAFNFPLVEQLVNEGLCERPESDEYIMALIWSGCSLDRKQKLSDRLRHDSHFLGHSVWRLFEVEGSGENSLAAHDKYSHPDNQWHEAILQLAAEGVLSRERLLDASLDALSRDFLQFRAGWFSRFHESLKPTTDERIRRLEQYGTLLGSSIPPTLTFALDTLSIIDKGSCITPDFARQYFPPALMAKSKSAVTQALALLDRVIKRDSVFAWEGCSLACQALVHESPDVQAKVVKLLDQYGDPSDERLCQSVRQYIDLAAASVKRKLENFAGSEPSSIREAIPKHEYKFHGVHDSECPIFDDAIIEPIESWQQLVDSCAVALEHPELPLLIEQIIDAISRLSNSVPDDFVKRLSPIKTRASKIIQHSQPSTSAVQILVASFLKSWLDETRTPEQNVALRRKNVGFICERLNAILQRLARKQSVSLLSAPTHLGGWVDPRCLARRFEKWQESDVLPDPFDQVVALLRLPLQHVRSLLPNVDQLKGEFWDAVRYASGISDIFNESSENPLWIAANSLRAPYEAITLLDLKQRSFDSSEFEVLRWQAIMFPAIRPLFFASGVGWMSECVEGMSVTHRSIKAYLELLVESNAWSDTKGMEALAIGLFLPDAECSGHARDGLIVAVEAERIDPEKLGAQIGRFLYSERSKPVRLSKALSDVANVSAKHRDAVRQILQRALRGGPLIPRDLYAPLELLYELLQADEAPLEDEATRQHLQSLMSGGKTGKVIKKLLS